MPKHRIAREHHEEASAGRGLGAHTGGSALALLLSSLAFLGGCGTPKLKSDWLDHPVSVDGDPSEWNGRLFAMEHGRFMVGLRNDASSLYICLGTDDPGIRRQILRGGMTVWFDPSGGKNKVMGIRYPASLRRPPASRDREGRFAPAASAPPADSLAPLQVFEPGGLWQPFDPAQEPELALAIKDTDGTLACEIKLPLQPVGEHPFALGVAPGKTVGIGVETVKMSRPTGFGGDETPGEGGGRRGGWGGRGGRGRGGGRRGGGWSGGRRPGGEWGGGQREGGRSGASLKPLNLWAKIRLAKESSAR